MQNNDNHTPTPRQAPRQDPRGMTRSEAVRSSVLGRKPSPKF